VSRLTGALGTWTTPWEMATKGLLNSGEDRRAEREDIGCGDCDESLLAEEAENAIIGRRRIARERTRGMAADALDVE